MQPSDLKNEPSKQSDEDILRRMLNMPPKPRAPKARPLRRRIIVRNEVR
jgi:hypothetical protein